MDVHTNRISNAARKMTIVNKASTNLPSEINSRSRSIMTIRRRAVPFPVLNRVPKRSNTPTTTSTDRSSMPLNKLMNSLDLMALHDFRSR